MDKFYVHHLISLFISSNTHTDTQGRCPPQTSSLTKGVHEPIKIFNSFIITYIYIFESLDPKQFGKNPIYTLYVWMGCYFHPFFFSFLIFNFLSHITLVFPFIFVYKLLLSPIKRHCITCCDSHNFIDNKGRKNQLEVKYKSTLKPVQVILPN